MAGVVIQLQVVAKAALCDTKLLTQNQCFSDRQTAGLNRFSTQARK